MVVDIYPYIHCKFHLVYLGILEMFKKWYMPMVKNQILDGIPVWMLGAAEKTHSVIWEALA